MKKIQVPQFFCTSLKGLFKVSFFCRLESLGKEDDSGATATIMFVRNDSLIICHIGDSCVV